MRIFVSVVLTTIVFGGLFPLIRSLPNTECAFLHFEPVDKEVEGTEFCGTEDGGVFIDLKKLRFPVTLSLNNSSTPIEGKVATFDLELKTIQGRPLLFEDLAIVHTKRLHLFVIHSSLEDYHHLHPEPTGIPGIYHSQFKPSKQGTYKIFAEMVPLRSASILIAKSEMAVEKKHSKTNPLPSKGWKDIPTKQINGYRFKLTQASDKPLGINEENEIHLHVINIATDHPIPFEKVMGEYVHLVAFDKECRGFSHLHPLSEGDGIGTGSVVFQFSFNTYLPGSYKIWAQLKIDNQDFLIPFDITVVSS